MEQSQKCFLEVFPSLKLEESQKKYWEKVWVERICVSQKQCQMKVFLRSKHMIPYQVLRKTEREIERQICFGHDYTVIFHEQYELSAQYTNEKLWMAYYPEFLLERKAESILDYQLCKMMRWEFQENTLRLICADSFVAQMRMPAIQNTLQKALRERFSCSFAVQCVYEKQEPKVESVREDFVVSRKEKQKPERKQEVKQERNRQNPNWIYGRNFDEDAMAIVDLQGELGEVVVRGMVRKVEERELRNEKTLLLFALTDFTDTIGAKIFLKAEQLEQIRQNIYPGAFIKIKGMALLDPYEKEITIGSVMGIQRCEDFTQKRQDCSTKKRVELHAHTFMSDMDAVVDVKDLVHRAMEWGHQAVAVTDHGVVQAFPDANHAVGQKEDFKVIYGVEAYLVDDLKPIAIQENGQTLQAECVVFDIETTGFRPTKDEIIEIGAVKIVDGKIVDTYATFLNPQMPIPFEIERLTGISDEMVLSARTIEEILPEFLEFCKDCILVAHNAAFDVGFIMKKAEQLGLQVNATVVDTVAMARVLLPHLNKFKLHIVAKELAVSLENHHRAIDDATATAQIFLKFLERLQERGVTTYAQLNELAKQSEKAIQKMPTYHAILLAKNETGRRNLYRLISISHLKYYHRRPRIPKSVLEAHREGLFVGSACEAGELVQALLRKETEEEIARIVKFYDYLEIQPIGNNRFMIESNRVDISSEEDLKELNRTIVRLGQDFEKPVVATGDVHFLEPEDAIYRKVIMAGKGFQDADQQAPLYFHTTEEMLEEFQYLGKEKAEEVVITNTNWIANQIERISPVRPDKCPPVIPNSDQTLRQICYEKATSMYGPDLPTVVKERLEHELQSIIQNGFAVMYMIAQKLVAKSNADGYLVGSRGSVGSSFVATMSGITEVNPLPAHYYCAQCFYSDFSSEEVRKYAGASGCDMPDKVCPNCGALLKKDGHDIPFETFLGFYGDKEPDIDLNFSGEYQSQAHDYTEVIFGKGHTFRAGTIGTLAEKTAYGYVLKYLEERGIQKRRVEIERIAAGCVGVRRTTGQHPGGIIVLPHGEEIDSFTPVQHPANDMKSKIVTTHFDYHSIDHNLLKLDILGHDDPTMIRMLEDLTGVDAKTIPLDEEKVLSLFQDLSALHLKPEDLDGCDLGCLGVPEFGTDFVMQMLRDTKPQNFSDLVKISGLSHGTDVWLNNAQTLITEGKCTLSTAICTRDDIMTYLIHMGVENGLAFQIMESVRKGKGLKPEMEEAMQQNGVPDWYIWSCKQIKYMFPKAHAAAYVMMAFRIAYFKVYYPLAYYAAYFSIRASAFDYEMMCFGKERLLYHMMDYKKRSNTLTKKEQDSWKDMRIVQEMYARGLQFVPIDLYRASANRFQIIDGALMPSFATIEGLGEKAAEAIVQARKEGTFLSQDDIKQRCKVSSTVMELMERLGILKGLPKSDQISIMDFLK